MADPSSKLNASTNPQTRCSNCQTVFEVARELLSSSDTRVRCGECLSIFDALEELRSAEQIAEDTLTTSPAELEETLNPLEDSGVVSDETAGLDITYSDFDIFSDTADLPEIAYFDQTRDTPDLDFDAVQMGNDETFNDYLFAHDVTIDASARTNPENNNHLSDDDQHNPDYAEVDFVAGEHPREPLIFKYRERQQPGAAIPESPHSESSNVIPRAHGSEAKSIGSPAVKVDVGKQSSKPKGQSESNPWLFRVGMLMLLGVLLGALFTYRTRPQLYNNPTLRPMLEAACKIVRCTLPARVDVASLKMVKRSVYSHPSTPNALVINVSFRNEANFAQQLPILQMVLSNRVGRVVAKQDFSPNYYMPNWRDGTVIEAKQQLDVKLEVTDPGNDAQNFEFHFREFKS